MSNPYEEHLQSQPDSIAEIDRASAGGPMEAAWWLSDRDVWYPNPYYVGAPQPHPEEGPDACD